MASCIPACHFEDRPRYVLSDRKRLRRLLLRWQAPQPCPAHPETNLTRPQVGRPEGYAKPYAGPYAKPYAGPYARQVRTPRQPVGAIATGRAPCGGPVARKERGRLAPLGGMRASAFDPSVSLPAAWCRLRRRSTNSAVRLPHGALAISAHLRCAAIFDGDPLPPCRGQGTNGTSHLACSACDDPCVTLGCSSSCCDDPFVTPQPRLLVTICLSR